MVRALLPAFPNAERRAKQGSKDRGDIGGIDPQVVIEVKAVQPKGYDIAGWLREADAEGANADADLAVVWFKLKGKANAYDWPVMMRGSFFVPLLQRWLR